MLDRCASGDPVTCPADVYVSGMEACISDWEAARVAAVELRLCRELSGIDRAEMATSIDALRRDVDTLRGQRWWWGVAGVALGVLLAVGIAAAN